MSESYFIERIASKDAINDARFVMTCASNNAARPALEGMLVDGDKLVAADGFTLAMAPCPEELKAHDGEVVRPVTNQTHLRKTKVIPKTSAPLDWEVVEGNFPTYQEILPTTDPHYRFALNGELLARIKEMPSGSGAVVIDCWTPTSPVRISSVEDGKQYTFLIMPMYIDDSDDRTRQAYQHLGQVRESGEADKLADKLETMTKDRDDWKSLYHELKGERDTIDNKHNMSVERVIELENHCQELKGIMEGQRETIDQLAAELQEYRDAAQADLIDDNETGEVAACSAPLVNDNLDDISAALLAIGAEVEVIEDADAVGAALVAAGLSVEEPCVKTVEVQTVRQDDGSLSVERQTFGLNQDGLAKLQAKKGKGSTGNIAPLDLSNILG